MAEQEPQWRIFWTSGSERYFGNLQPKAQARVKKVLQTLRHDPYFAIHVRALHGELEGLYRYRLGNLRIVFRVLPSERRVCIIAIGSRGDIY